ncbi:MAG: c-type cytochrome, partial [Planctomycetales bacterium]
MSRFVPGWIHALAVVATVTLAGNANAAGDPGPVLATRAREPASLVAQGDFILAGNRRSGTVSVINADEGRVVAEHQVARRIAHLVGIPNTQSVLVLDDADRRLFKATLGNDSANVKLIAEVPLGAVRLAVAPRRRQVFISGKWSRTVVALTLDENWENVLKTRTVSTPFAPRELLLVDADRVLLAADAFGGRIAVIDASEGKLIAVRELAGHNIRGLAASPDGKHLHVAHQKMPVRGLVDYEELHWGRLIVNTVQVLDARKFLDGDDSRMAKGWLDSQGDIGNGAGDPSAVATGARGLVAVALSGVGEVAVRRSGYAKRIPVQSCPEALLVRGDRLHVANRLSDSISVIDLDRGKLIQTMSLGPTPELAAADRGERLFFDAKLSHDQWMSCHSCHTDGHTAGFVVDTLGDGDYGAPKLVPSLLGTRGTGPWSWTGASTTLAAQVRKTATTTMHGEELTPRQTDDLVAYLLSLKPPPPRFRASQTETER